MSRVKTKVVHVITRLDLGGAQQNTLYTVGHLDPDRFSAILIAGPGGFLDEEARAAAESAGFCIRFLPELVHPVSPGRDLMALLRLFQIFKDEAPQIVHTHSSKAGILGRLAAWMAGVPVVIHTYHGFGFHERQPRPQRTFYAALERLCCRLSSKIVFVSEANRRYARQWALARPEQEVLIRSGIKLSELPAAVDKERKKASLGWRMHRPMVVSVGNLKPQKNPEAFLRVAARCLKELPETGFVFVGGGHQKTRLEAQAVAQGIAGRVMFLGWRRDIAEILAAADVFALTSLWEGLPRALIEAMKTGLPCVCFGADGIRDVIRDGENGYWVEPGAEETMAEVIVRLLKDPALARDVGERAAASIGPEFDIDGMVRRQEELYSELMEDMEVSLQEF